MTMKNRYITKRTLMRQLSEFTDVIKKGDRSFELQSASY